MSNGSGSSIRIEGEARGTRLFVTVFWQDKTIKVCELPRYREEEWDKLRQAVADTVPVIDSAADMGGGQTAQEYFQRLFTERLREIAAGEPAAKEGAETEAQEESPAQLLAKMPEDVRRDAEAMLKSERLIEIIADDIRILGVAGERLLTVLLYVIGTSRLLLRPLAAIIRGASSSGKSLPISKVSTLFPDEAIIKATKMTPEALCHMPAGSLRHKWVVAGERSRNTDDRYAEATRALREMLSEGRLDKWMPMKRGGGEIRTERLHQEGPISFVESTTLDTEAIFPEDLNRCLLLTTDEGPDQTRRVLKALAATFRGDADPVEVERIILKHHAAQRMLQSKEVVIPFADRLGDLMPSDRVEARRAFGHVLYALAAIALLHQYQRQQDGLGRIIATRADYALAYRLLAKPMQCSLTPPVNKRAKELLAQLRERYPDQPFGAEQAYELNGAWKDADQRYVREDLKALKNASMLVLVTQGVGPKGNIYRVASTGGKPVLPSVEEVFGPLDIQVSNKTDSDGGHDVFLVDAHLSNNIQQDQVAPMARVPQPVLAVG